MFDEFVSQLGESAEQFPDVRKGGNRQCYSMRDACLSAFGVLFTQSPSFLAYQREMHVYQGRDNAESLFGVGGIPSDNEIRNLLDPVAYSGPRKLDSENVANKVSKQHAQTVQCDV